MTEKKNSKPQTTIKRVITGYKCREFLYVGREERSEFVLFIDGIRTGLSFKKVYDKDTKVFQYLNKNHAIRDKFFNPVFTSKKVVVEKNGN